MIFTKIFAKKYLKKIPLTFFLEVPPENISQKFNNKYRGLMNLFVVFSTVIAMFMKVGTFKPTSVEGGQLPVAPSHTNICVCVCVCVCVCAKSGTVFTTLHFLLKLLNGPLSYSIKLHLAEKACQ